MILTVLLSFLTGAMTVIFLEIQGLEALLAPLRDLIAVLVGTG